MRLSDVVMGKYLALLTVLAVPCLIMGLYPLLLSQWGNVSMINAYSTLLAFFLLGACLLYSGMGMLYSPVYDTVLATLPIDQSGRGVGMNDLSMEAFASIGVAIFGPAITGSAFRRSLMLAPGLSGARLAAAANASALLWIFVAVQLTGIVWLLAFSRRIYQNGVR